MENRHGLAVEGCVTRASGYGERAAALEMLGHRATAARITVGADKGYDTRDFVEALRLLQVTPHVAQNTSHRSSAIDARTTRHAGYEVSQWTRKRVEEIFGWLKTVGLLRKTRHRGRAARELDVPLQLGGVQPGPHPQPGRGPRMTERTVTDRPRGLEWRRPERSQPGRRGSVQHV